MNPKFVKNFTISVASAVSAAVPISLLTPNPRDPTFAENIGPLFLARCAECHRPGGFAPFSLLSYEDSAKRTELIRRVAINRQMPPTSGESEFTRIPLQPKLTDQELLMLQQWVRAGAPEGPKDRFPAPPLFHSGWKLGQPDLIVRLDNPTPVRISGNPYWRAYFVDFPKQLAPKGLVGFEVRPAAPNAVRHVLIAQDPHASSNLQGHGFATYGSLDVPGERLIGAWAPGYIPLRLPPNAVLPLDPSPLLIQVHYAPTGKEESGQIEIALYFGTGNERRKAKWMTLGKDDFKIEPNETVTLTDSRKIESDIEVVAVHPEARMFADQVNLLVQTEGEPPKTLFRVYAWKLDWVGAYNFQQPVKISRGATLIAKTSYDNGRHAPANEFKEKPQLVTSGPTLMDEIFKVHVLYVPLQ